MNFKHIGVTLLMLGLAPILACVRPAGIGIGGRYLDGKMELIRRSGSNLNKAVDLLESVAMEEPLYEDSLTLLSRAYYRKGRYHDAIQVAQRSLAINRKDEIAWIILGLTQLHTGDHEKGMEALKGGLTLLSQVSKPGYRDIEAWDRKGSVRNALSRAAFITLKGISEKEAIIRNAEQLLTAIDDEEWLAKAEESLDRRT